ncbi:hypothetical protein JTE90_008667 [Oedothorax gibbosus]|uniref:Uncharacterized protein n=1 Tax=Oedothorax gibbosus TaxID=931172 RepID=A0AAV6U104_9ARAC|nr:hypothetical protein JTE90_008667 [Oedothorax gibbosus]
MSDRKTSKAVLVSSDEEDFIPLKRKMKSSGEVSKKGKRNLKVDLNLGEAAVPRVALPPPTPSTWGQTSSSKSSRSKKNSTWGFRRTSTEK